MLEANTHYKVNKIKAQIFVRDGGLQVAKTRGIEKNLYYVDIPLDEEEAFEYILRKKNSFYFWLEKNELPPLCNDRECWDGKKCLKYCKVSQYCIENPYLEKI